MDASDRIKFEPVLAAGQHVYCYLDDYYVARISVHADHRARRRGIRAVPRSERE